MDDQKPASAQQHHQPKHVQSEKRAQKKERRRQRLEAEREAELKRRKVRLIKGWSIAGVVIIGLFFAWYFLIRDDGATEQVATQPDATQTTTTVDPSITSITGEPPDLTNDTEVPDVPNASTTTTAAPAPDPNHRPATADEYGATPCPADAQSSATLRFDDSFQNCLAPGASYTARFVTNLGDVVVALDTENTPLTSNNFIALARHLYYDGTLLHRTDPGIGIIQGGSPTTNSAADPGPGYTIVDEGNGYSYPPGKLVMARTGAPNSAGAQFFFSVNLNTALLNSQGVYVVFGDVIEGLDVLEAVLASHMDIPESGLGGAPNPPVTVERVEITETA